MDASELQRIATHSRSLREIGIALVIASGILALLLFVPLSRSSLPNGSLITVATSTPLGAFDSMPSLEAKAAIVYDLATGETLYARNAEAQLPLASLTKLLTVYAAFTELSPQTPVTIPSSIAQLSEPHILSPGQIFALEDLARITLTASLNDGAVAIAEATAQQEHQDQIAMLASAASGLGLAQTYAVNGSGLDVSAELSGGYGSARDLARLAGALVAKAPSIALATTENFAEATTEGGTHFNVKNTDPMVATIPRLLLSKTGLTDLAGGNLVLVFDAGISHPVAVVVLGSSVKSRFTDGMALVAASLAHFSGVASL